MRPDADDIAAPPFPPGLRWAGDEGPARMEGLTARGPVLVQFFSPAQVNGVRTLPYLIEWNRRYADEGLSVIGVASPRHPFTADAAWVTRAVDRLAIPFPVAIDTEFQMWADYGCHGWPSLFLWSEGGVLRWYHFGEGAYAETEGAIQEELRAGDALRSLPEPMDPVRPTDDPRAQIARPSDEIFLTGDPNEPWTATAEADVLTLGYEAGGVWATFEGPGTATLTVDDGPSREIDVADDGLVELASHPAHERHRLRLQLQPGQRLWSVSFVPGLAARR